MDRKAKLAALAQKRREENALNEKNGESEHYGKSVSKISKEKSKESSPLIPSGPKIIRKEPKVAATKASSSKNKIFKMVREEEHSSPKRFNKLDTYEEDGFVVGSSDEEEIDEASVDISSEEEVEENNFKSKKIKTKRSKSAKKSKKSADSDEDNSESEPEMNIEDEIAELDTSNIIASGPGRRTRSSR